MFNDLRWEKIVHFAEIGGIVDHHCLNFIFINPNYNPDSYIHCIPTFHICEHKIIYFLKQNKEITHVQ